MNRNNTAQRSVALPLPQGWSWKPLHSLIVGSLKYGINAPSVAFCDELPAYLRITDITESGSYTDEKRVSVDSPNASDYILEDGDIAVARTGASVGKSYLHKLKNGPLVYAGFLIRIRLNGELVLPAYLHLFMQTTAYWRWIKITSVRSGQPGVNSTEYASLKVPTPQVAEQEEIVAVFSAWDRAIEMTEALIAAKQRYKQAMLQHIFRARGHQRTQLSKVLQRVRIPVNPQANSAYHQIGIRSHGKGIFHKPAVTGESLGNKRVYQIKPDCFVFNVVFAWEQAVARTTKQEAGMIASHRFPMYEPIEDLVDIDYLLYFFKTKLGKHLLGLASPGGAGRNRTLSQAAFLKLKVALPSRTEQSQCVNVLTSVDQEISLLEQRVELLQQQKKGLMQQLLTGKIRVKIPRKAK